MTSQKKNGERQINGPIQQVSGRLAFAEEARAAESAIDRLLSDLVAQDKDNKETEDDNDKQRLQR